MKPPLNPNKTHPWVRDVIAWHCYWHPRCTAITTDPHDPEAMRYSISLSYRSCRDPQPDNGNGE
jgi:hypothetical protein